MYMEGSTKSFLAIVFAILLVVSIAFWSQTLFVARFIYDLVFMNARDAYQNLQQYLHQHWPFAS